MKKSLLIFLLSPLLCLANGPMQSFKKSDSQFDFSESYYYGNFQTSSGRSLAGLGLRYKEDEFGFDAAISGAFATKNFSRILQGHASALYFPLEGFFYGGIGAGLCLRFKENITNQAFLLGTLGVQYANLSKGLYFAEATLQSPVNFDPEASHLSTGFRLGIGF